VSWNGGGFDLPVLHYRGLIHGVTAPRYWDMGEGDYRDSRDFKWNNYISRYHMRHLDLMDLLAMYQPRGSAPLDQLARLMGCLASWAWMAPRSGAPGRKGALRDSRLLRNRRGQYLPRLSALPVDAGPAEQGGTRGRTGIGQSLADGHRSAALERVHCRLGGIMLIDAKQSALLVVDVQGRLVPAIAGWQALLDQVVWLIRVARRMGIPVLACEQYPQGLGPTHPGNSGGTATGVHCRQAAFFRRGRRLPRIFRRRQPSATGGVRYGEPCLRDADRARTPPNRTAGLRRRGGRRLASRVGQGAGLARMRQAGAVIVSREMVAFEWLRKADSDLFREISRNFLR
jgi:hypothetical protein